MKVSLQPGISNRQEIATTPEMGVTHVGSGPGVLSTPSMIGVMERTCLEAVLPHLDEGEQTVGTMVHVWHRAAVPIGEPVESTCTLLERDRRRLLFEVRVARGDKVIGEGTHERFVVNRASFGG